MMNTTFEIEYVQILKMAWSNRNSDKYHQMWSEKLQTCLEQIRKNEQGKSQ